MQFVVEQQLGVILEGLLSRWHVFKDRVLLVGLPVRNHLTKEVSLIEKFFGFEGDGGEAVGALLH